MAKRPAPGKQGKSGVPKMTTVVKDRKDVIKGMDFPKPTPGYK